MFDFQQDELEGIAPTSVQQQYLQKFGFVPPPLPSRYVHQQYVPSHHDPHAVAVHSQDDGFGASANVNGNGEVNKLVARRGKKRIKPTFVGSLTSSSYAVNPSSLPVYTQPGPSLPPMSGPGHPGSMLVGHGYEQAYDTGGNGIRLPAPPLQTVSVPSLSNTASASIASGHYAHPHQQPQQMHHGQWIPPSLPFSNSSHVGSAFYVPPPGQAVDMSRSASAEDVTLGGIPTIDAFGPDGKGAGKGKRKAGDMDVDVLRTKARTLGGDRVREIGPVREIASEDAPGPSELGLGASRSTNVRRVSGREHVLTVPSVKTYISVRVEGSEDILEGSNFEDGRECHASLLSLTRNTDTERAGPTEVVFVSGKQTQWLDYLPSPVIGLAATSVFCAVAMADGCLNVYSPTGRK